MYETWQAHRDEELAARAAAVARMDNEREAIAALLVVVRGPVATLKLPQVDEGWSWTPGAASGRRPGGGNPG
jgi:hypothetical protein